MGPSLPEQWASCRSVQIQACVSVNMHVCRGSQVNTLRCVCAYICLERVIYGQSIKLQKKKMQSDRIEKIKILHRKQVNKPGRACPLGQDSQWTAVQSTFEHFQNFLQSMMHFSLSRQNFIFITKALFVILSLETPGKHEKQDLNNLKLHHSKVATNSLMAIFRPFVCVYIYECAYTHTYTHVFTHICTYVYTHTGTYIFN